MSVVARVRRPLALLALAFVLGAGALVLSPGASALVPRLTAQSGPRIPAAPARWATDEAGFLAARTVAALDARLENYERQTGHQVLVWIGRTLGENEVLEDWAVRTFEAWKVGRKGIDDGLVLFIFAEDRKISIEVGYGLEDEVPDAYAFRVINNILAPGFRDGRPDEAVDRRSPPSSATSAGTRTQPAAARTGRPRYPPHLVPGLATVLGGIVFLVFLVILITNPTFALWLLVNILGGGRGGGGGGGWGGGGGGGFSGGGGRSGGGGASGGW